MGKESCVNNMR